MKISSSSLILFMQIFVFLGLLACGGPRDPVQTEQGLIFELKKPGVTLSRCRGGKADRIFIDKSVADKVRLKDFRDKVILKVELGSYSCLPVGSIVRMFSPGFKTMSSDRLRIDKVQVMYRWKINRYQMREAGFSSQSHLNSYLEKEMKAKEERGIKVFNKNLVTLTHFTYVGENFRAGGRKNFSPIRPVKLTKKGQRLFSCAKSKADWTDIWLSKDFSSRKCEVQMGDISLQMTAGGYSCHRVGNEILVKAGKEVELGQAIVSQVEVLKWANLTPDQMSRSGLSSEQLQFLKAKVDEEKNSGFVTLTHFEFQPNGDDKDKDMVELTIDEANQSFPDCQMDEKVTELKEHPADITSHIEHGSGWVALGRKTCVRVGKGVKLVSNDPNKPFIEGAKFHVKTLMKIPFHLIDDDIAEMVRVVGLDPFRASLIHEFGKSIQCASVYLVEIEEEIEEGGP